MAKAPKGKTSIITPNQQWLALSLLAILALVAVFYFGIGIEGNGVANGGG